jgi:Flp pilus assembly pilin Flp
MRILNEALLRVLTGWQNLQARVTDEEGQTLAEYGVLLAVVAAFIAAGVLIVFRGAIVDAFQSATDCLSGSC